MRTLTLLLSLCLLSPAAFALNERREGTEGHGGDDVGLQFQAAFQTALTEIEKHPNLAALLAGQDLAATAKNARVLAVDCPKGARCAVNFTVTINGVPQESIAVNDPGTGLIFVNRLRWRLIQNVRVLEGIALHEVASLRGLEDTGRYPISAPYVALFGLTADSLVNPEAPSVEDLLVEKETLRVRRAIVNHLCGHNHWNIGFACTLESFPADQNINEAYEFSRNPNYKGPGHILWEEYDSLGFGLIDGNAVNRYLRTHECLVQTSPLHLDPGLTPRCLARAVVAAKQEAKHSK